MKTLGTCQRCGARVATAAGASERFERGRLMAQATSTGRVVGYVLEKPYGDAGVVCRECCAYLVREVDTA